MVAQTLNHDWSLFNLLLDQWEQITPEALRELAIEKVIGPWNKHRMDQAQKWNEVPLDERATPGRERVREQVQGLAESMGLDGTPEENYYADRNPVDQLIDPDMVDWQGIIDNNRPGRIQEDGTITFEREQPRDDTPGDTTFPSNWNA